MKNSPRLDRSGHAVSVLAGILIGGAAAWVIVERPRFPSWLWWAILIVTTVVVFVIVVATLLGPVARSLAGVPALSPEARHRLEPKDHVDAVNYARSAILQSATGFVLLAGLLFTAAGVVNTNRTLETTQEGQRTDLYTRSVEQLGSEASAVRLGAIFALDRIRRESPRDERGIMMVLASYVRLHVLDAPPPGSDSTRLANDVSAALTVISHRDLSSEGDFHVDLSQINFQGRNLRWVDFRRVNLRGANLRGADLSNATLRDALVGGAKFDRAYLRCTNLTGAGLVRTSLVKADLRYADLSGTDMTDAILQGALVTERQISRARVHDRVNRAGMTPIPEGSLPARSAVCTL